MKVGTSYFGNRMVRHVAADMEGLAARGFTGVLHTFSENDLRYYAGTMGKIVDASHAAGLEVQIGPWGVGKIFGGEAESGFVALEPEVSQVLDTGRRVPAACPSNPRVRAFVREWADAAIDTGADRIFWDEPHWVNPRGFGLADERWGCRCELCRARYMERFGADMPEALTPEVLAFRENAMVDFLADVVGYVARQGVHATVCLLPHTDGPHGMANWSTVAGMAGLHTIATDPYWKWHRRPVEPYVREYARRLVELRETYGVVDQLWIQGYRLEPEDVEDIRTAVAVARSEGVTELWTWGFEACAHMSHLAGSDSELIWSTLCDALAGPVLEEARE
jgi:hypothetical protein